MWVFFLEYFFLESLFRGLKGESLRKSTSKLVFIVLSLLREGEKEKNEGKGYTELYHLLLLILKKV